MTKNLEILIEVHILQDVSANTMCPEAALYFKLIALTSCFTCIRHIIKIPLLPLFKNFDHVFVWFKHLVKLFSCASFVFRNIFYSDILFQENV